MVSRQSKLERFRAGEDPALKGQAWAEAGRRLIAEGRLEDAHHLLRSVLAADPACEPVRAELARLTALREREPIPGTPPRAKIPGAGRREDGDPSHPSWAWGRASTPADGRRAVGHPPARHDRQRTRAVGLAALTLVAALLLVAVLIWGPVERSLAWLLPPPPPTPTPLPTLTPAQVAEQFTPQWQAALQAENWDRALEIVDILNGVDPGGQIARKWGLITNLQYGQALVRDGQPEEALARFEEALAWQPDDEEAQTWQQATRLYLAGQEALTTGRRGEAADAFSRAYALLPDYGDLADRLLEAFRSWGQEALDAGEWDAAVEILTRARTYAPEDKTLTDLLATAYRQRGIAFQEQNDLEMARTDLETALLLRPDDEIAQSHYDDVMYILFPPKRIEISIGKQRLYAWEGDTLIYNFPVSTGLRGRDTAVGHFKVLDKIPSAYSSIWRLTMPYWLGIYYVGRIENGIHALPIRPDGSVMWAGLLGQRASYGCVILDTPAARALYHWAEIGTPVDIHY